VLNTLDQAQTRSNAMGRALRQVDALPEAQAQAFLPGSPAELDGPDKPDGLKADAA
jgi:DNA recombination protein RmuC